MKYWNAVLRITHGCTPVNGGCSFCWSAVEAHMRQFNPLVAKQYRGLTENRHIIPQFNGTVRVHPENIIKAMKHGKPHIWQIWNDLFHEVVPESIFHEVVSLARFKPRDTFICLTKRPERMRRFCNQIMMPKNLFIGVSVSCQQDATTPLIEIMNTDAPSKLISFEPAIGAVDFKPYLDDTTIKVIIAGGETGPRAHIRDCPQDAIWQCKNQCEDVGVMFFFKGWGDRRGGRSLGGREYNQLPWVL